MARPSGLEPETYWLEVSCSIQLSYGRVRGGELAVFEAFQVLEHLSFFFYTEGIQFFWEWLIFGFPLTGFAPDEPEASCQPKSWEDPDQQVEPFRWRGS